MAGSLRHRFPGITSPADGGWSRFDAPAGTQMVDVAIEAMASWMRSGATACAGGYFAASDACADLVERTRAMVGRLFNADPGGVVFGPNMTTLTMSFSRAVGATLRPGRTIVGTALDHDANVTPWRLAAHDAGADHVIVPFDPAAGTLDAHQVIAAIDERTAWVTLPGASNLLGSAPDLAPIIAAAHDAGARVFIDAVALAPHRSIDIAELGCDVLATSPYKWYGPHSGVLWISPDLRDHLPVYKVRPAPSSGPARWETGMANFEALAGIEAAARFLLEHGMDRLEADESEIFAPLLEGLQSIDGVTVYGVPGLAGRTPTAAFTVRGHTPSAVCESLAAERIAAWDGDNYAVEVAKQLGVSTTGGVVRVGLARYVEADDVARLLDVVERLAR